MTRSTLSAAILLAAVAGMTGCTTSDATYLVRDDNTGIAIVKVPQSDLFQWYYRHEALQYIRDYNPNFKEDRDIFKEGVVYAGERIDQPKVGPDGKPLSNQASLNTEKEYQIAFKRMVPINKVTVGPAPTTTMPGMMPNNGMPMNTVVPVNGVQNVNPQYSGTTTNMPQYSGVQNVNTMTPSQMQQPNSQMMMPAPNYR
jgi:hypothetical protein